MFTCVWNFSIHLNQNGQRWTKPWWWSYRFTSTLEAAQDAIAIHCLVLRCTQPWYEWYVSSKRPYKFSNHNQVIIVLQSQFWASRLITWCWKQFTSFHFVLVPQWRTSQSKRHCWMLQSSIITMRPQPASDWTGAGFCDCDSVTIYCIQTWCMNIFATGCILLGVISHPLHSLMV